jgi:hypothetical protein
LTFSDRDGYGEAMLRERHALVWLSAAGCSLFVKFDDSQIPIDATPDTFQPIPQAECDYGGSNDTPATAFPVTPANTGPAAVCPNADGTVTQVNWYSFDVPVNTTSVSLAITYPPTSNGNLDLTVFDSTGQTMLADSDGFGSSQSIVCPGVSPPCVALGSGTFLFEVSSGFPGDYNSYSFALAITGSGSGSGSGSG